MLYLHIIIMVSFILDLSVMFSYSPGDVLMIQPHNMADTVDEFMDLLHLTPDAQFTLQQNDPGRHHVIHLFRHYFVIKLHLFLC